MLNFPKNTLEFIKKHLLRQQREVEKNLKEVSEDDPAMSPALAESSEPGTDSYIADSHAKTVVLEHQLKNAKTSITAALSKIRKGNYGKCEKCSQAIEIGRLLAMPTAQYCVSCSQKKTSKR
ncbi:TraR/DksA C4-type zinc finger protein [Candidatus Daviesbacteria bacterium]|nr:TraR/DksA C4-type zinc finger protein [Candidatus Daviesbacteria bacterium]